MRSVIADYYGLTPDAAGAYTAGLMRAVGFDKVFDFAFAADLTILEETTEFLDRVASGERSRSSRRAAPAGSTSSSAASPPS